jgi:dTDP-4-dehydrorhamnose reductase
MISYDFSKVVTIGAGGQVGTYIDFGECPNRSTLDILNGDVVLNFMRKYTPSAIILLAGATDTVRCENDPVYAYELNVRGTYNVAIAAQAVGATMVYVSTSRVFKGDESAPYIETDVPVPDTHYGRTKHIGEIITTTLVPHHIVVRTAWVFGGGPERDNKFYGKVLHKLRQGSDVVALSDVYGSPTYGKDLIETIKKLIAEKKCGIFHVANYGVATRFDIASMMAEVMQSQAEVRAVDRSYFDSTSILPTNESIISGQITLRPWQQALCEYIGNEWKE